jgi:AcrR family transcriptional regulator
MPVPTEYAGRGDPKRTIDLLWGAPSGAAGRKRGPKPALAIDRIVEAATEIADTHGLEGLSMRAVAERLGIGTMSLYRYVPGKAELLDVMVDRASASCATLDGGGGHQAAAESSAPTATLRPPTSRTPTPSQAPSAPPEQWRERLEWVAWENRRLYERHPWLLWVFPGRPPLGPGTIAKYDRELRALEGIGLGDVEMDRVLTLVLEYVRGAAMSLVEHARAPERTGKTEDEWWHTFAPALERVLGSGQFPLAERVGAAVGEERERGYYDPEGAFEFGLARLLDGIAAFVRRA